MSEAVEHDVQEALLNRALHASNPHGLPATLSATVELCAAAKLASTAGGLPDWAIKLLIIPQERSLPAIEQGLVIDPPVLHRTPLHPPCPRVD